MSKMNALAVEAGKVRLGLSVSALSTGHKLIPTNDSDIMTAYKQNCIDDYGNGACSLYEFEIYNFNKSQDVIGKIDFNTLSCSNLRGIALISIAMNLLLYWKLVDSAVITFSSVTGGRLTATVEGYEDSGNNISHLGGV